MERRRYLESVGLVASTALPGCIEGDDPGSSAGEDTSTDVVDTAGDGDATAARDHTPTGTVSDDPVAGSMTGWERRDHHEGNARAEDPPSVDFDPENDRLFVRGVIVVGSSSCKQVSVEAVEYGDGELSVSVVDAWTESAREETPRECTDDISTEGYEVAVSFDDGLPARVVAEERDANGEQRRTVRER